MSDDIPPMPMTKLALMMARLVEPSTALHGDLLD